jgi:hypothetical protein
MASKALKAALATALITGTDAYWGQSASAATAHNEKAQNKQRHAEAAVNK